MLLSRPRVHKWTEEACSGLRREPFGGSPTVRRRGLTGTAARVAALRVAKGMVLNASAWHDGGRVSMKSKDGVLEI